MPIVHTVDTSLNILRVTRSGTISTQDEDEAFRVRKVDPLVTVGIPVLVDSRDVTPSDSTEVVTYLAKVTSEIAQKLGCGPLALVVSSDVEFGMARMFMALVELKHPRTRGSSGMAEKRRSYRIIALLIFVATSSNRNSNRFPISNTSVSSL